MVKEPDASYVPFIVHKEAPDIKIQNIWSYYSLVCVLMYLTSNGRPDIFFTVHEFSRFAHCISNLHEKVVLSISKYLYGTIGGGDSLVPPRSFWWVDIEILNFLVYIQ